MALIVMLSTTLPRTTNMQSVGSIGDGPFVAPLRDSLVGGWQNLGADIKLYDFKNKKLGFHLLQMEAHDCSMTT
jgi:hypothetical protein